MQTVVRPLHKMKNSFYKYSYYEDFLSKRKPTKYDKFHFTEMAFYQVGFTKNLDLKFLIPRKMLSTKLTTIFGLVFGSHGSLDNRCIRKILCMASNCNL